MKGRIIDEASYYKVELINGFYFIIGILLRI